MRHVTQRQRSARSSRPEPEGPPGTIPQQWSKWVQRRPSLEPLPQGVRGRLHERGFSEASAGPAQPPRKTLGADHLVEEGTSLTKKQTGTQGATTREQAIGPNAGPTGTPERQAYDHNHGTSPGSKQHCPLGAARAGSMLARQSNMRACETQQRHTKEANHGTMRDITEEGEKKEVGVHGTQKAHPKSTGG